MDMPPTSLSLTLTKLTGSSLQIGSHQLKMLNFVKTLSLLSFPSST